MIKKTQWKNWPYWLRGGILAVVAIPVLFSVFYFSGIIKLTEYELSCMVAPCVNEGTNVEISIGRYVIFYPPNPTTTAGQLLPKIIIFVVLFFIAGGIFGWLYGKIKNRQNNVVPRA